MKCDATTKWKTKGGIFANDKKAKIQFALPKFDTQKAIEWDIHVDSTTKSSETKYDMIIGSDVMDELGLDVKFSDHAVQWGGEEGPSIPLKASKIYDQPENNEIFIDEYLKSRASQ